MSDRAQLDLKSYVRDIPDFPKPGILFRDITPLLASPEAMKAATERLAAQYRKRSIDVIVAAEARGFILGTPLAMALNVGFVPIGKPGKLPFATHAFEYDLEYGSDTLEIHVDGLEKGQKVLVFDDLLATGGTVDACCKLVEKNGAVIESCAFLIELTGLGGREKITPRDMFALLTY